MPATRSIPKTKIFNPLTGDYFLVRVKTINANNDKGTIMEKWIKALEKKRKIIT